MSEHQNDNGNAGGQRRDKDQSSGIGSNRRFSDSSSSVNRPEEEEIELADLVAVLYRQKNVIAGIILLGLAAVLVYSSLAPKKYAAFSMLEIGQLRVKEEFQNIESTEAAALRVKSLARKVAPDILENNDLKQLPFSLQSDLAVQKDREGKIIEVRLQTLQDDTSLVFLRQLNKELIKAHDRVISVQRQGLINEIEALKNKLALLKEKESSANRRLKDIEVESSFLQQEIEKTSNMLDEVIRIKARVNLESQESPLGLLLFSSEIQRMNTYLDEQQHILLSEIPREREEIKVDLQAVRSETKDVKTDLKGRQVLLQNIIPTNVLIEPSFSKNPVWPQTKLLLVITLAGSLFIAIFLAFFVEFWQNNKGKIRAKKDN